MTQYLSFTLGDGSFALPIGIVREIIEYAPPTHIPAMPAFLKGLINLRGSVVPVMDLSERFRHGPTKIQRRTSVVIIEKQWEGGVALIGILVDNVSDVLEVDSTQLADRPPFGIQIRSEFIEGVLTLEHQLVTILDPEQVFAIEELAIQIGEGTQSLCRSA